MGVLGADNGWWMDVWKTALRRCMRTTSISIGASRHFRCACCCRSSAITGVVLERGELQLEFEPQSGNFRLHYHEHLLPIDPALYPRVLSRAASTLPPAALEAEAADTFASVLAAFGHLPPRDTMDAALRAERHRDKEMHKANLARLVREHRPLAAAIGQALTAFNGTSGEAATFDDLDSLLEAQACRLRLRVAEEISYRRFFDINDLAALGRERQWDATHRPCSTSRRAGQVDGSASITGRPVTLQLFPPTAGALRAARWSAGAASASEEEPPFVLCVVAEKIVASHEQPPLDGSSAPPVSVANLVNGLFIDGTARPA
jgi:(1->4)-alpha-D-glucan 1-alpha-D-glucosylmutase